MGFYGNITNTSRTQFQFDKIYSNRWEMDNQKAIDGIYAGRYILIEYDQTPNLTDYYLRVAQHRTFSANNDDGTVSNYFIFNSVLNEEEQTTKTIIRHQDILTRNIDIVFTASLDLNSEQGTNYKNLKFYLYNPNRKAPPGYGEDYKDAAIFELISDTAKEGIPTYTVNYNIDTSYYGKGRAYDSTVWQKTYMDGVEKYIMIAELNTVVPTFDISADAPTQRPLVPHFDTQSTDVYYKLHWQPSWGFRIKESEIVSLDDNHNSSINMESYPSDIVTEHHTYKFNPQTGLNEKQPLREYNGAIFFNKDGFDHAYRTYYSQEEGIQNTNKNEENIYGNFADTISIEPTGQSGQSYNKHDGTTNQNIQPDIQELRILLPSLGNTISNIWDKIYGYDKKVYPNGLEQPTPNNRVRYQDTSWKDAVDIENDYDTNHTAEDQSIGGMTRDVSTLAGCINNVHDLMGMILTEKNDEYLVNDLYKPIELTSDTFVSDKYYTLVEGNYIKAQSYSVNDEYYEGFLNNGENWYNKNYLYYVKTNNGNLYYRINKYNTYTPINEIFTLNEVKTETSIEFIYKIGNNEEKSIKSDDLTDQTLTQIKENILNELFEYLNTLGYDTLLYKLINEEENGRQNVSTLINRKALLNLAGEEFSEILYHTGYNYEYIEIEEMAQNLGTIFGCILQMKKLLEVENSETRDNATVTGAINQLNDIINNFEDLMPGEFLIVNQEGKVSSAGWTTAQEFDYLNIGNPAVKPDPGYVTDENRWIELSLDENNGLIELYHNFNPINDTQTSSDKNTEENHIDTSYNKGLNHGYGDSLDLYTPIVDSKGHVIGKNIETVTLPFGYKFITTNAQSDEDEQDLYTINADREDTIESELNEKIADRIEAGNTQDTFAIETANKWIQIKTVDTKSTDEGGHTITLAHEIHPMNNIPKEDSDLNVQIENQIQDTITVQDTEYDKAGHLIANNAHTYTLPYGYKFVNTNGLSEYKLDLYTNNADSKDTTESQFAETVTQTITADNTQDTITINTANKWIQTSSIDGTAANGHTIEIAHEVHPIDTRDKALTNLNDNKIDNITIQDTVYDNAGHIIENRPHTYTLPYGYRFINTTGFANGIVSDLDGSSSSEVSAFTTQDVFNINPYNKWIQTWLISDSENHSAELDIAHAVNPINEDEKTETNLNSQDYFEVQDLIFDQAGHVTANQKHKYSMPFAYKTIQVGSLNNAVNAGTGMQNSLNVVANNHIDTLQLNTQNRWIVLDAEDSTDNIISIGHAIPDANSSSTNTTTIGNNVNDAAFTFGRSIEIPEIKYDETGHIFKVGTHSVNLPKGSINANLTATASSVITGLKYDADSGLITQENNNIGNLVLTDYSAPTVIEGAESNNSISANDSINAAFNKLQAQIYTETAARSNLDFSSITESEDNYIYYITQSNGKINAKAKSLSGVIQPYADRIKTLEDNLSELQKAFDALKLKVDTEHSEENIT